MASKMTHCYVKIPVKPLDESGLEKVRQLEQKLGLPLIAFNAQDNGYAKLTDAQLEELDALGKELGASIVAYSNQNTVRSRPQACGRPERA